MHGTMRRRLDVGDAANRSEYAARVNIARAKHARRMMTRAEFVAEVQSAEVDRQNKTGDLIREVLATS